MIFRTAAASVRAVERYNGLIARSKAHWRWPSGYLEPALRRLRITANYLADNVAREILCGDKLAGFFAVKLNDGRVLLDHLWIEPDYIGRGAGGFAVSQVIAIAKEAECAQIEAWPDPPAEGFYRRLGFEGTGERVPSRIAGGPIFTCFALRVDGGQTQRTP